MKHLIVRVQRQLSTGAGAQIVALDAYPFDERIEWTRVMARVIAGDATLIILGVRSGVQKTPMKAQKITNVGQSVNVTSACQGSGDFEIYAEFTGTAAGEMLELTAFGRIQDAE